MPAGVAVWQPYGAVGWNGLDGVWVACGTLARMDAGGWWEVEGAVWLRSNNFEGCSVDAAVVEAHVEREGNETTRE